MSKKYSKQEIKELLDAYINADGYCGYDFKIQTSVAIKGKTYYGVYLIYCEWHRESVYEKKPTRYYYYIDLVTQKPFAVRWGKNWRIYSEDK